MSKDTALRLAMAGEFQRRAALLIWWMDKLCLQNSDIMKNPVTPRQEWDWMAAKDGSHANFRYYIAYLRGQK